MRRRFHAPPTLALCRWIVPALACLLASAGPLTAQTGQVEAVQGPPGGSASGFGPPAWTPPSAAGQDKQEGGPRQGGLGPPGMGGRGGPGREPVQLVDRFDQNRDGWLNLEERVQARAYLEKEGGSDTPRGRRGPGPGFGARAVSNEAGARLTAADVESYPDRPIFDPSVIRTFFLEFENEDWEQELEDFHDTDVEVPATVTVDGKSYPLVGVHFRGMSSYMMVSRGQKRSLNLSFDFVDEEQDLGGYRTFNLLNSNGDPTFLRLMLAYDIAREYLPTPQASFVRVVINGGSWGLYVSMQQIDKRFTKESYGTGKGARWKVPGSPNGQGTLAYLGDDLDAYRRIYEIKSKEDLRSWVSLMVLCQTLNETPADRLEARLATVLDVDQSLRFLALENVLVNSDGYWTRASDYYLYQHADGIFHLVPYDYNETFASGHGPGGPRGAGGPPPMGFPGGPGEGQRAGRGPPPFMQASQGMPTGGGGMPPPMGRPGGPRGGPGGGRGSGGVELDPLVAADNASRPLISRLLAVPAFRTRYLQYVHQIAEHWLDWEVLGPMVARYRDLIEEDVRVDTRKLYTYETFLDGVRDGGVDPEQGEGGLQNFAAQRRAYLLDHADVQRAAEALAQVAASGAPNPSD